MVNMSEIMKYVTEVLASENVACSNEDITEKINVRYGVKFSPEQIRSTCKHLANERQLIEPHTVLDEDGCKYKITWLLKN